MLPTGLGAVSGVVSLAFWRLLSFNLFIRLGGLAVLGPLVILLLSKLIFLTGGLAIAGEDVLLMLESPEDAALTAAALLILIGLLYMEQAGLTHINIGANQEARVPYLQAAGKAWNASPRLLRTALAQFLVLLFQLGPFALATGWLWRGLLAEHTMHYYLVNVPGEFQQALIVTFLALVAIGAVALRIFMRWSIVLPVVLYEQRSGFAALKRSHELSQQEPWIIAQRLLSWLVVVLLLALPLAMGIYALGAFLSPMITHLRGLVFVVIFVGGLTVLWLWIFSFLLFCGWTFISAQLYLDLAATKPNVQLRKSRLERRPMLFVQLTMPLVLGGAVYAGLIIVDDLIRGMDLSATTEITALRGSVRYAPENSLSALHQASASGADAVVIDVQQTKDGVPVLLREPDLTRVAGYPGNIWQLNYEEVSPLDFGSWFDPMFYGEPIATLEQAIETARNKMRLIIALQAHKEMPNLVRNVVRVIEQEEFEAQCVLVSADPATLDEIRRVAPALAIGQIVTDVVKNPADLRVDLLSMHKRLLSTATVRRNRKEGIRSLVWPLNDTHEFEYALETGVDSIVTDEPARLRTMIEDRASLSEPEILLLALATRLWN